MAEMIFMCPNNYLLVDAIDLFIQSHSKPLAIVAKLKLMIFEQRPQPNIVESLEAGRNFF